MMRATCVALVILGFVNVSKAQTVSPTVLWQARSCIGEVGFRNPEECIAMAWVHKKRAVSRGISMLSMTRAYSVPVRVVPRSRTWIWELNIVSKPRSWPRNLRWSHRHLFFRFLTRKLRGVLDSTVPDPCPDAMHYGGPMDPVPPGFEVTECLPNSRQIFYKRIESVLEDEVT